ncbi:MAG: hypothetical protein ACK4TO_04240 [Candidatus Nitrosotenuis sp.]
MAAAAKTPYDQSDRPIGITVLGIIYIIFGVLIVLTVVAVVAFTAMIGSYSSMISDMLGNTMTAIWR